MKKICMITTRRIEFDTRILNEAETLSKYYQVTILTKIYPNQKLAKHYPFKIKLIAGKKYQKFGSKIFISLYELMKAAFRESADIYHAHDIDGLLCAFPAALIKLKILIYDSHEIWSDTYPFENLKGIQRLFAPLEKLLMLKVKMGITASQSYSRILEKKYRKKFLPLYNYPVIYKKLEIKKNSLKLKGKVLIHVGATDEGRGIEQMIEVMKFLPLNYKLVFLGGGKTVKEMQAIVRKEKLTERITFLSPVEQKKINQKITGSLIGLALTQNISKSYYYSMPNKIFQYIAAEVPILGSNFPEYKKIILQNKIGEVIDPIKPKVIAQKIIEMTKPQNIINYKKNIVGLVEKYN